MYLRYTYSRKLISVYFQRVIGEKMNILVTGGLGLGGSWVSRQLLQKGHSPIIYDNNADTSLIPDIKNEVAMVSGSILDIATIIRVIKQYKIKLIAHLAALMPKNAQSNPLVGFQVNAKGTVSVLEAARIMEVQRVVYTSSKWALSPCVGEHAYPKYLPVDENYPAYPVSPTGVYSAAKVASELMGNAYSDEYYFEFVSLRFASVFGPGKSGVPPILSQIIENAMLNFPTIIPNGGDEKDDITYIKDFASAVVLACLVTKLPHRLYHIGTGKGSSYRDFASSVKKLFPEALIQVGPGLWERKGLARIMDISRAKNELGFVPQYEPDEAVKDYVETMRILGFKPVSGSFRTI